MHVVSWSPINSPLSTTLTPPAPPSCVPFVADGVTTTMIAVSNMQGAQFSLFFVHLSAKKRSARNCCWPLLRDWKSGNKEKIIWKSNKVFLRNSSSKRWFWNRIHSLLGRADAKGSAGIVTIYYVRHIASLRVRHSYWRHKVGHS